MVHDIEDDGEDFYFSSVERVEHAPIACEVYLPQVVNVIFPGDELSLYLRSCQRICREKYDFFID